MNISPLVRSSLLITLLNITIFLEASGQNAADSLVTSGNRKIETGNYEEAGKDFEQALSIQSGNKPALNGKITSLYLQGRTREATRDIDKAIENSPGYGDFYFTRGMISNQRNNYRRALEDFNRAIDLEPSNLSIIYLNRGITRLNLNELQSALMDFEMAIDHNPQNIAAYNYRGMINYRNNQYEAAIEDFNNVITISPTNDVAHYNRGMAFLRKGDTMEACADFHRACQLGNRNACQMIIMECQ